MNDVDKEREMREEGRKSIKKFPSGHISRASKCIVRPVAPLEKDAAAVEDEVG